MTIEQLRLTRNRIKKRSEQGQRLTVTFSAHSRTVQRKAKKEPIEIRAVSVSKHRHQPQHKHVSVETAILEDWDRHEPGLRYLAEH